MGDLKKYYDQVVGQAPAGQSSYESGQGGGALDDYYNAIMSYNFNTPSTRRTTTAQDYGAALARATSTTPTAKNRATANASTLAAQTGRGHDSYARQEYLNRPKQTSTSKGPAQHSTSSRSSTPVTAPDNRSTFQRWSDQILGVDSTQVTGGRTDWGKAAQGAVYKGMDQAAAGMVGGLNTLDSLGRRWMGKVNPVASYVTDELRTLGKTTLNDIIGGVNDIAGTNIGYIQEGETAIEHWLGAIKKEQAQNQAYFAQNANTSRAAQIVDKYGTSFVAAIPQAIEALMFGKAQAVASAGAQLPQAASAAMQYAGRLANSSGLGTAGIMAQEGMKNTFRNPQFWTSYLEAIGGGYESAKEDGMSDEDAELYSLVNGFLNAVIEIGGGDEDLGGFQSLPRKFHEAAGEEGKHVVLDWIKDSVLGEGLEEVQQGIIERGLLQSAQGASAREMFSLDPNNTKAAFNPWTAAEEFTGGAVVGGLLGGGETGILKGAQTVSDSRAYRGDTQTLADSAREAGGEGAAARVDEIQQAAEKRGKMTIGQARELYGIIEENNATGKYEQKAKQKQLAGNLQSAFRSSNYELTDDQAQEMAARYDPSGDVSMTDYVIGAREAYDMGYKGVRLMQAKAASDYAPRMTDEQFNRAWAAGATAQSTVTETADTNTEEGKTRLAAALNALGAHAAEAEAAYEAGQDVNTFAAAMNKASALYAANGMDLTQIVQDARDGKSADIVGRLTDAQVETAARIGKALAAEQAQSIKQSAAQFREIRQQAAAAAQDLTAVNAALQEAKQYGQSEQNAFKEGLASLEAMVKADPSIEGTEAYNEAYDKLLEHRKNVENMQKTVKELEAKRAELQKQQTGKRKKGTVSLEGGEINGVKVNAVDRSKLSRQQKKVVAMVEALADAVNIDYVLFDGDAKGMQGAYTQGGTIYLNINAGMATGKSLAAATLSHELTHYLQEYAPEEYAALREFLTKEVLNKTPGQLDAMVRRQLRLEPNLDYDEAMNEVIANACQRMLLDSKAVRELARQNMTLAEKVADVIADLSNKIRAAFEEAGSDDVAFRDTVKAVEAELDRVQALWDNALKAASENYNAEQATGKRVRTSAPTTRTAATERAEATAEAPARENTKAENRELNDLQEWMDSLHRDEATGEMVDWTGFPVTEQEIQQKQARLLELSGAQLQTWDGMHPEILNRNRVAAITTAFAQDFFRKISENSENYLSAEEIETALDYDNIEDRFFDADTVLQSLSGAAAEKGGRTRDAAFRIMDQLLDHVDSPVAMSWIGEDSQDADFAEWYDQQHPSLYYPGYKPGDLNVKDRWKRGENTVREQVYLEHLIKSGRLSYRDKADAERMLEQLNKPKNERPYFYQMWADTEVGEYDLKDFQAAVGKDGKPLFQVFAMEHDEDRYREMLTKWGGMSSADIDRLFLAIDVAMDKIKANLEALDYAWEADIDDRGFNPVKPNSDPLYKISVDFSTLCRKRILQGAVQNQLQAALNRALTREEGIAIRDALVALQEEGKQIEVACALCYVESARMRSPAQIQKFLNDRETVLRDFFAGKTKSTKQLMNEAEAAERQKIYEEYESQGGVRGKGDDNTLYDVRNAKKAPLKRLPDKLAERIRNAKKSVKAEYKFTPEQLEIIDAAKRMSVTDFTSPEGLENLAKNHREIFDAYTSFIRNATNSKGIENDTWWRAGDSSKVSDLLIEQMNRENGTRTQSWSDFQVKHLMDYIAATIELATRGAKQHAYTKVIDYVDLMGDTGVMINMSLIPTREFNGTLRYDDVEGFVYKEALRLREKYHATAGTICIGVDNEQIRQLLASDVIDYIIPYHHSGMAKHTRKAMRIPNWTDYQDFQNEKALKGAEAQKNAERFGVKLLDESDPNWHKHTKFSDWFDLARAQAIAKAEGTTGAYGVMTGGYAAMQAAAENYKKLCAERGLAPKFSYGRADFSGEDNYWKLLIDRKMVDNVTGDVIEQKAIKPQFDIDTIQRILDDELERYGRVKEDQNEATRRVTEAFLGGKIKGGMKFEDVQKAMQKPVDNISITNITQNAAQLQTWENAAEATAEAIAEDDAPAVAESMTRLQVWDGEPPKKTQYGFKLMSIDEDGNPHPLFVDAARAYPMGKWYTADAPGLMELLEMEPGYAYLVDENNNIDVESRYPVTRKGSSIGHLPSLAMVDKATLENKRWMTVTIDANGKKAVANVGKTGSKNVSVSTFAMRPGWHAVDIPSMAHIGPEYTDENGETKKKRKPNQAWFLIEYPVDNDYNQEAFANKDKDIKDHIPEWGWYSFQTNKGSEKRQHWFITGAVKIVGRISEADARKYARDRGFEEDLPWLDGKIYDDSTAMDLDEYIRTTDAMPTPSKDEMRQRIEAGRREVQYMIWDEENKTHSGNTPLTEEDIQAYLQTGVRAHVRHEKARMQSSGDLPVLMSREETAAFIADALDRKVSDTIKAYGKIGDAYADDLFDATNGYLDAHGGYLEIDANRIAHSDNHSFFESDPRNVPLSREQMEHINEYADDYDEILQVLMRKDGSVRIFTSKAIPGGKVVVVELVSIGRNSIQPVTGWQNTEKAFNEIWGNKRRVLSTSPSTKKVKLSGYTGTLESSIPDSDTKGKTQSQVWDQEAIDDEQTMRDLDRQIEEAADSLMFETDSAVRRAINNRITLLESQKDKLIAKERRLSRKTSIYELLENLSDYRYSDLESLAEQISEGAWDIEEDTTREELEDGIREMLEERAADLSLLEQQMPKYGYSVRPVNRAKTVQSQVWDDTFDDTASEANDRELAYTRLQSENAILSESVAALKKLTAKKDTTIGKLQDQLRLTKTQEVREADARKLAKQLLTDNSSQADLTEITERLKALGDYILQTPVNEVTEQEIKDRARSIASEIVDNAVERVTVEDETMLRIAKDLKGRKLTIDPQFHGELDGGFQEFRKRMMGKLTIASADSTRIDRSEYSSVSQYYADLQSEYGQAYFPDLANEGEELSQIARVFDLVQPIEVNPFDRYEAEVTEELANRIAMDALGGIMRVTPPTFADKQKARRVELQEQIKQLKAKQKIDAKEAGRLYQTIYDLSVALDKAESKYRTLRTASDYRLAQARREGSARALEIKAAERARAAEQIQAVREYYLDMMQRAKQRRDESAGISKYRKQVEKKAGKLYEMLIKNDDKMHVPEVLKAPLAEFLSEINFTSKRALNGGDETKKDQAFGQRLLRLQQILSNQQAYINGTGDAQQDLGGYIDVSQDNLEFLRTTAELITKALNENRSFTINQMTAAQLRDLSNLLSNLSTAIRGMNHFMANARFETVREAASADIESMKELGRASAAENGKALSKLAWENGTPYYVMKRFGAGGRAIFDSFTRGWEKMAFNVREIINFTEKTYTDKEVKAWKNEVNDITLSDGREIRMTTGQIMSLAMLINREQAVKHISKGGIRIGTFREGRGEVNDVAHYHLTDEDIRSITGLLSDRQAEVAQMLQRYMADKGSEWGNEISMRRFGYKFYTEGENYFPIKTDSNDRPMADTDAQQNSMFRLLNLSASKSLNPKASNALIVEDIFDVFADHMADMAKLNGMGLPILDAIKWFNFKERIDLEDGTYDTRTMQGAMEQAFGSQALHYFRTLMKDINGVTENSDRGAGLFNALMSNYKAAAVGANLRVALLQPTSYVRASYLIKPQYLLKAFTNRNAYREMIEHSGTGVWKEIGGVDTNLARGMRQQIQHDDSWKDKLVEASMTLAEKGDQLTWGRLWVAAKMQAKAEHPDLSGDALLDAAADLFREVIYSSQVMDSTLTRSEIMRGKTNFTKGLTAFMAEPTLSYNMLMDAAMETRMNVRRYGKAEGWQRSKGYIAKAFTVYVCSATFSAIVESIADAFRDDDEEEDFLLKWAQAMFGEGNFLSGNLAQDLTIIGKVPYFKAFMSALQGYENKDMTTAAFNDAVKAFKIWKETIQLARGELEKPTKVTYYGKMTEWGKIYKSLQVLSEFSGIPSANLTRDAIAIWNSTAGAINPNLKVRTYDSNALSAKKTEAFNETVKPTGISKREYQGILQKVNEDGNSSISQAEMGAYLTEEYRAGRISREQRDAIWSAQGWKDDFETWSASAAKKAEKAAEKEAAVSKTGLTVEEYDALLKAANTDGNTNTSQDELGTYLRSAIRTGKMSKAQAEAVWNTKGWKTSLEAWSAKH